MSSDPLVPVSRAHLEDLEKKVTDLEMILGISEIISSTLDLDKLMNLVMDRAKREMDAEACSILLFNRETGRLEFEIAHCDGGETTEILRKKVTLALGQGIAGWVAAHEKPLFIEDVTKDNRFFPDADRMTGFTTKSLIAVPLIGRRGLIGVAEIINPKGRYDPGVLTSLCRQFAIAIDNALLHRSVVAQERLRQEIEIAATLQQSFLPRSPSIAKGRIRAMAVNMPAAKVGGDLYDFVDLDDNRLGIFIGDVSGKGISAALYMAKIISDFRSIAAHHGGAPADTLQRLNTLLADAPRGMFLTAIYLTADSETGALEIACAGHPPPVLLCRDSASALDIPSGPPLGITAVEYETFRMDLTKDAGLLLLTDGVFDAKNRDGDRIGYTAILSYLANLGRQGITEDLTAYVRDYAKGTEQADDLTLVEIMFG